MTRRVAIVGVGPKGLFALERLLHYTRMRENGGALRIDAYEPHPTPGAGAVYEPGQPPYLLMNFQASQVNMWPPDSRAVPLEVQRSFVEWRGGASREQYPPRAQVGRYLADGLSLLLKHRPGNVQISLRNARVDSISRSDRRWLVQTQRSNESYDEVLVTTGHQASWSGALSGSWPGAAPLIPAVYPVDRWLGADAATPGADVAIRGFALSFIDAALALTEGRGGSFLPDDSRATLRYLRGEDEVGIILPFSRTGRPMLAKPGHGTGSRAEQSTALACEQILSLCPGFDLEQELLPIIAAVADAAAPRVSALPALVGASRNQPPPIDCGPREELSRSLQIAQGKRAPDLGWALGQAWRSVYPAIVERLSGGGLSESDRLAFRALAGQMERVAFGPPAVNAAKLLALVDAGKVDLCFVSGAELTAHKHRSALRLGGFARPVDVVVDAVLPPPGAVGPLADLLLARGYAHTSAGRRGIEVMADGECVAPDGGRLPGLSAAGRITEDCIVGNDTLNRALHPLLDRWAARVTASESARQPA